jgi:hypothetical protein
MGTSEERISQSDFRIVEGDASWTIEGRAQVHVGDSQWIHVKEHRTLFAEGDVSTTARSYSVSAEETVILDGPKSLKLVCGQSMIELLPDEIVITSKKLTFAATEEAVMLAPDSSLHLEKGKAALGATDKVEIASDEVLLAAEDASLQMKSGEPKLVGKKVGVYSDESSLELDSDASLDGGKVKLNCKGGSESAEEGDEPDELATSWIEIELADQDGAAVPAARYVIESSGVKYRGVLDSRGKAKVPVRPGSCKVSFPDYDGPSWDKA